MVRASGARAGLDMKRWLFVALGVSGLVAATAVLVTQWDSVRTLLPGRSHTDVSEGPTSPPAIEGKSYRYEVGHCGLSHIVDFDGSYWDVDPSTMSEQEDARFGINSDVGSITLTSKNVAVYRSSSGGDATLRRHSGPKTFFACM